MLVHWLNQLMSWVYCLWKNCSNHRMTFVLNGSVAALVRVSPAAIAKETGTMGGMWSIQSISVDELLKWAKGQQRSILKLRLINSLDLGLVFLLTPSAFTLFPPGSSDSTFFLDLSFLGFLFLQYSSLFLLHFHVQRETGQQMRESKEIPYTPKQDSLLVSAGVGCFQGHSEFSPKIIMPRGDCRIEGADISTL